MSSKSSCAALRSGGWVYESLLRPGALQRRCFSASVPRNSQIVSFPPTSSPELDSVLGIIKKKILLPCYLTGLQRKQLRSPRYAKKLEADPITMVIDGEPIQFYYANPLTTMPNTRKLLLSAIDNMKTKGDWQQLHRLLEGLHRAAKRKLEDSDYSKMTRKAVANGCMYTIIECARQVKRTGFKLDKSEKVNALMIPIQRLAIDSNWDADVTKKALKWAEMIVEMVELKDHRPKRKPGIERTSRFPLHRDPQMLGVCLHLAAAMAVRHYKGQDVRGKVTQYARDIVNLWPEDTGLLELHGKEAYEKKGEQRYLTDKNRFLETAVPILNGMNLALEVIEPELAGQLKSRRDVLSKEVESARVDETRKKGLKADEMYEKLFSADASQEEGTTAL